MDAAVPEELQHLDLAFGLHVQRRLELVESAIGLRKHAAGSQRERGEGNSQNQLAASVIHY